MYVAAAGPTHSHRDFGLTRAFTVCKQFLNVLTTRGAIAAERSRFAALPQRYLDDVGMTASERVAALGYEEPMLEGWRIVASHG